ncbi:MAG: adenylate/guanylate cyclase domain-containing protein [bacterium]|nr:adenylate/guanylate cyclase domain-containing protein [bacterium]
MKRIIFIIWGIILSLVVSSLVYYATDHIYIFEDFEFKTLDLRFKLRGKVHPIKKKEVIFGDIIIVDIDEKSLKRLGKFYGWPRSYHAKAINFISSGKPKAIGFDILFSERDKDIFQDIALCKATKSAGNVIHSIALSVSEDEVVDVVDSRRERLFDKFSYSLSKEKKNTLLKNNYASLPILSLMEVSSGLGYFNIMPNYDGITRDVCLVSTYKGKVYPCFALEIARVALGIKKKDVEVFSGEYVKFKDIKIPIDKEGRMLVNYTGPAYSFQYIPYYWVLEKRVPKEIFEDKIILFGTSAAGLMDLRSTPFSRSFPGVEIHANIIHNIKNSNYLAGVSKGFTFCIVLLLGAIVGLFSSFFGLISSVITVFFILIFYVITTLYYFEMLNIWLPSVQPLLVIIFSFLAVWIYRYRFEEREKRKIKNIFEKYVARQIVNEILSDPKKLKLGGEKKEITIMFSDIREFTSLSENLMPEEVVSILNRYFSSMAKIIFKNGGTLDKFIGDGIMAFFGSPVYTSDHAQKAVLTAIEMQKELSKLNKKWKEEGKPSLSIGIGINTGEAVVGNIGSDERMEYTAIGDNINLCARLQIFAEAEQIIISESTYSQAINIIEAEKLELIKVKGRKKLVQTYKIIKLKED